MNPLNRSDRIRMVRERHADLVRWAQLSRDVIQKLHRNGFKFEDLGDLSSIPELNLRGVSQLRKSSVEIPVDYRKDKRGFGTLILKIFALKIDDIYDGEFLLGRDTQGAAQNLFALRILGNGHVAAARIHIAIEGNLAVIGVGYVVYSGPVGQSQTLAGFGDVGEKMIRQREESIVAAGTNAGAKATGNTVLVASIFGIIKSVCFAATVGVLALFPVMLLFGGLLRDRIFNLVVGLTPPCLRDGFLLAFGFEGSFG